MVSIEGIKSSKVKQHVNVDADGNLIISPDTTGITIDGTVTANQGGTWNIGSVTTLPSITGTVTANQGGTWNIGSITTLPAITGSVSISSMPDVHVDAGDIDTISQSQSYLKDVNGNWIASRGSLVGYTLQKPVQSSVQYSTQAGITWPNSSAQFTGFSHEFSLPSGDITESYIVIVYNPSNVTDLNMYVQNEIPIGTTNKYYALYDKSNTAAPIVVPKSTSVLFNGTAWSSCFTSINSVLTDESGDLNDASGTNDVPFVFGAVNDAIYFGATTPFNRIRLNVTTAGVYNATTIWEYWNGSAWTALTEVSDGTNATTTDGTASFKRTGLYSINWYSPSDWTSYDIAGNPLQEYWVRCRIATFTSITTGPILDQGWYKATGVPEVHGYLIKGVYGGDECRVALQNATALGATDGFTAYVIIKRL